MKSDLEISQSTPKESIFDIASKLNISADGLEPYGKYIAKVPFSLIDEERVNKSHLILVTAMSPTRAGIGKTTVCIGLSMALNRMNRKSVLALREPSLGPCFGMKGGATGGGYSQVIPMEKINLHFTGDFHAITSAHNMIAALLDNYIYQHRDDGFFMKEVTWKRVLDVNDRNLRNIVTGLGKKSNGVTMESGFDITPASEIMAILCLSRDEEDLRQRIDNIILGIDGEGKPFHVSQLGITGSIVALLMDALHPNLVQTIEHTSAFVHGGPFANIAHGCNSIIATKMAMTYGDYVVTEAGFGADLGAEKFLDIKCRTAGIHPEACVLVCTTRGIDVHGLANLDRHIENLRKMNQRVVVTLNRFATDTDEQVEEIRTHCEQMGVAFAINEAFMKGGEGCMELAQAITDMIDNNPSDHIEYVYSLEEKMEDKISRVAQEIYRADQVLFKPTAKRKLEQIKEWGFENLPVCIAKTQYSFTDDAKIMGAPEHFNITIRDVELNAGAGMIVAIAGEMLRMPGLPKSPQAERIDVVDGVLTGLS